MNKNIFSIIILYVALALASCSDELAVADKPVADGETVTVNVTFDIANEKATRATDGGTRAVDDAEDSNAAQDGVDTKIKNVWVLQFDGTSDDAHLIGTPEYIEATGETLAGSTQKVHLVASQDDCAVVFIANTFDPQFANKSLGIYMKLKAVKALTRQVTTMPAVLITPDTPDATKQFPDDADYHIPFNAITSTPVYEGSTISCQLKRSIARIDIALNIKNSTKLTVESITLRNIPQTAYYVTDYDYGAEFPASGATALPVINFATDALQAEPTETETEMTYTLRYYVTPNVRGISPLKESDKEKNWKAPSEATCLFVQGTYKDGDDDIPIDYTFYLGDDMQADFNLHPNSKYIYTLNINGKGNHKTDSRITDYGMVDYTLEDELANCYICNPPLHADYARKFRIPITRINEYWGPSYANYSGYCLDDDTDEWEASVVWADFDFTQENADGIQQLEITKDKGKGILTTDGKRQYFEVAIPRGVAGNIVIGIKKRYGNDLTQYVWSWHLWITDYNPDECVNFTIDHSREPYYYAVPGGSVHRYAGKSWTTGNYKNAFIMDRIVGAYDTKHHSNNDHRGNITYQWGRKDPFPETSVLYNGTATAPKFSTRASANTGMNGKNMDFTVNNPFIFLTSGGAWGAWSSENANRIWEDKNTTLSMPKEKKSLFDPSPLGWIIPRTTDLWADDFNTTMTTNYNNVNTNYKDSRSRGFPLANTYILYYWPNDGSKFRADRCIAYPKVYWRHPNNGNLYDASGAMEQLLWISESYGTGNGKMMWVGHSSLGANNYAKAWGFHVRPVRYINN